MRNAFVLLLLFCADGFIFAQQILNEVGLPASDSIQVTELPQLNSRFRDVNISLTPNSKYLYFMSGRGQAPWSKRKSLLFRGDQEYDGDIWWSERVDSTWQKPNYLPATINSTQGEDEPNISADGQLVYFQSWSNWVFTGGPYYIAQLDGTTWKNKTGLGGGINRFFRDSMDRYDRYATDGMAVAPNGKFLLVAVAVEYDGNMDLHISKRENGSWTYPQKLDINTPGDERSVFIAGDSKTIYFGSDGYGGAGGLDIFKTTLNDDGTFGKIINIGKPFNTEDDDYGFVINATGDEAYFIRNDDIFFADLSKTDNLIKPLPTTLLEGIVEDCKGRPQAATIQIYNLLNNNIITTARSNKLTGAYAAAFERKEGKYLQRITYMQNDTVLRVPFEINRSTPNNLFFKVRPECEPVKIPKVTKTILPKNWMVHFEFDKYSLTDSAQIVLDDLVETLANRDSSATLMLIGHTDSKGTDGYNDRLSQRRAASVKAYLAQYIKQDIEIQLDYKGEQQPLVDNDTDDNRAINRRVEIVWKEQEN